MRWVPISEWDFSKNAQVLFLTDCDYYTGQDNYIRQGEIRDHMWYDVDINTAEGITHIMTLPEYPDENEEGENT